MKLKIRGLIFTGFAAAVFAQSASAVVPPSQMVAGDLPDGYEGTVNDYRADLKKTVTAQLYTDETFQERETTGIGYNSSTQEFTEKAVFVPWKYGDGGFNKEYIKLDSRKQLASTNGGTQDTEYVQIVHAGKNVDQHYVEMNTASITVEGGTGDTGADKIEAAGQNNATSLEQGRLTTAKAVYDFVTDQLADVSNKQDKLTESQADAIAGFGSGGDSGTAVAVGQKLYDSTTQTYGDSNWAVFGARANGTTEGDYHLSYLEVQQADGNERDKYWIDIKSSAVANADTAIAAAGSASGTTAYLTQDKLTTAKAVYDYAVKQDWGVANAGKKLVINDQGIVDLTDTVPGELPPESEMPAECKTQNGGKVCALVAYWGAAEGTSGEPGYIPAGVRYEWTIMAPTGN